MVCRVSEQILNSTSAHYRLYSAIGIRWKIRTEDKSKTDITKTKHNPEKANNTKHSKTKLPWLSCLCDTRPGNEVNFFYLHGTMQVDGIGRGSPPDTLSGPCLSAVIFTPRGWLCLLCSQLYLWYLKIQLNNVTYSHHSGVEGYTPLLTLPRFSDPAPLTLLSAVFWQLTLLHSLTWIFIHHLNAMWSSAGIK